MTSSLTYLSLGAGVQSSALLVCSARGLHNVPRADVAFFADTGDEPAHVYRFLEVLEAWSPIPIRRVSKGRLSQWVTERQRAGQRFVTVPLYTSGGRGMLRRQCTREFKLEPIIQGVRAYLGVRKYQKCRAAVTCLLGISVDEAHRMKPSRVKWVTNTYPLVDANLTRQACVRIVEEAGLPTPQKSACVFCPYHSDATWRLMKATDPESFAQAVAFDEAARDMTMRGLRERAYVHRSCLPLAQVDFTEEQEDFFGNECEGMCGV